MNRIKVCLAVIIFCFLTLGCGGLYKAVGLNEGQVADLVQDDQIKTVTAIGEVRDIFWQTVSIVLAGVGTVTTGLLVKWLGT